MPAWAQFALALIVGVSASLIAPAIHWWVEIRRGRRTRREYVIDRARIGVAKWNERQGKVHADGDDQTDLSAVDAQVWFARLRPHLSDEAIAAIRAASPMPAYGDASPATLLISDEIDKLDKKWRLA